MKRKAATLVRLDGVNFSDGRAQWEHQEWWEDCGPGRPVHPPPATRDWRERAESKANDQCIHGEVANSTKRHKNDKPNGYPDNTSGFAILETAGAALDPRDRSLRLLKREYVEARRRRGLLLPTYEARTYVGLSPSTFGDSLLPSEIPHVVIDGHRLYSKSDLQRWEEDRAFEEMAA